MSIIDEDIDQEDAPPKVLLVRSQRTLQIVLGLFWLLDAGLQFQPFMFGKGFKTVLLASASGQPAVISWIITNVVHFLGYHIAVWNTFFALIQAAIGAGLLFRRTVRPALIVSFFWVIGVWFFGEGLGMILTGSASALTGAPGSVLLYGLIGLMAWPRTSRGGPGSGLVVDSRDGVGSSSAGQGIGGAATPLLVWSGYWSLAAVLFLFPASRTKTSVSSAVVGMSSGEPSWYSHFLTHFGNHFGSVGVQASWLLAIASLVIGWGPLVAWRPGLFLLAGGVLSAFFWISGQGLGAIFTGSGTDPNTAPLIILLAAAMVPATTPDPGSWRSPFSILLARLPSVAIGSVAALGVVLFLSAAYPVRADATASSAMAGMAGMSQSGSGGDTPATASCTTANNGAARSGLDVTDTPNMVMSGTLGMNMNGSDASAAAGLNRTKSNWSYTGPGLPASYAQLLVAEGANGSAQVRMAQTGCAPQPTFSQEIEAFQYVQSTSRAVAGYSTPSLATAAGYVAVSPTSYPIVYYVNPSIVAANAAAHRTLDPAHVDGLVFAKTPSGREVLTAAMYVLPSSVARPPTPDGALVQWHQRTNVCAPTGSSTSPFRISGVSPCPAGSTQRPTPYVTMVWQVPVAGGPLAIQPPDIQIAEASIMATTTK